SEPWMTRIIRPSSAPVRVWVVAWPVAVLRDLDEQRADETECRHAGALRPDPAAFEPRPLDTAAAAPAHSGGRAVLAADPRGGRDDLASSFARAQRSPRGGKPASVPGACRRCPCGPRGRRAFGSTRIHPALDLAARGRGGLRRTPPVPAGA